MLKTMNKRNLIWRISAALLVSLIALLLQAKASQYIHNAKFLFLYPVVFFISWLDFPAAVASIIFTTIVVFTHFYGMNTEQGTLIRIAVYFTSTLSIAWLISYTKKREQVFAQKMRETSQQLYSIVENMQDAFFVVDSNWVIAFVNRNHEKITRSKKFEHVGKKLWEAFPIHDYKKSVYWRELEGVMQTGVPAEFEAYFAPLKIWTEVHANKTDDGGVAVFYRDITQRKLQEEALASNEQRFRALADSMPQIVFVSNQFGKIIYLNKQWEEFTGLIEKDLFQFNLNKFIHPDDLSAVIGNWKMSIKRGIKFSIECRIKNVEGDYRWHLVRSVPITNEQKIIENWFGTSTDIHDLRSAREAVRIHEEKFETIANNIPPLAWMSDGDGWVSWYNLRWQDYTGLTQEELEGWNWQQVHHPDHVDRVVNGFKRHLISGKPWEEIYPIRGKDGIYRWFLSRAIPIKNGEGKIVRWFGTNTDIDEQVKIEAMLNESQLHFRQLANSIPHIIWTSKNDGSMDFYNDRFYEYTGLSENEEMLQSWKGLIHPEDFPQMVSKWSHSLKTGEPYHIEYRLKDRLGGYSWFLGLALPMRDQHGTIVKWFGSCTNIEDRKHLSDQLELRKQELESALVTRDEFLSIASHELKTPLTSLKLNCQLFRRSMDRGREEMLKPERVTGLCDQIEKQVGKLNRLVDDMLDISRIRTGNLTLRQQEFELNELINEVLGMLRDQFRTSGCPMPELECTDEPIYVTWDRVRIEQVLMNLLTNTIRYGNNKPVTLKLTQENGRIFLAVKDNGIGIAPENIDKIFYRFEKIKNPKEVAGLGLGLFITKQIVEAHGGRIWVESQLGKGSEFKIQMPC